jgi:hypothetical protein
MRKRLINLVIDACYLIDKMRGKLEHYESESIPYCGYHYHGTKGVMYYSKYFEGNAQENVRVLGFTFYRGTEDGLWWLVEYKDNKIYRKRE